MLLPGISKLTKLLFLAVVTLLTLPTIGCASLNKLLDPHYAIDANGNEFSVGYGANYKVKIEGTDYMSAERPSVPAAPKKPVEPKKPIPPAEVQKPSGNAPSKPVAPRRPYEPSFDAWFNSKYPNSNSAMAGDMAMADIRTEKEQEFYNSAEYRRYQSDLSKYEDANEQYQYDTQIYNAYQQALAKYNNYQKNLQTYNNDLTAYQNAYLKYQQDNTNYEKEFNEYQKKLPQYQKQIDAQVKSIQSNINQKAPDNWERYVEGKYLIYKGAKNSK